MTKCFSNYPLAEWSSEFHISSSNEARKSCQVGKAVVQMEDGHEGKSQSHAAPGYEMLLLSY